eukprot:scaffold165_cov106-Skeletonema_dohrnii-CCMP3373.AAC.7
MPRVHGINLGARRGRRRSGPLGVGVASAAAASSSSGLTNNVTGANNDDASNADPAASSLGDGASSSSLTLAADEQLNTASNNIVASMADKNNDNDDDINVTNELGKVCGSTHQMTLNDTISAAQSPTNNQQPVNDQGHQPLHSPTTPIAINHQSSSEDNSVSTPPVTESQATAITSNRTSSTTIINTCTTTNNNDSTIHTNNNTSNDNNSSSVIKPQSKESIQHLEFSSHSFSVPSITKKSTSNSYQYDDDDFGGGGGTALSFGIGPSLETLKEEAESTEQGQQEPDEEDKKQQQQQQKPALPKALNPNAQWLYKQCSTAKSKMEYPHSTLHLSTKILMAIQQHYSSSNYDSDTVDEDERIQTIQSLLFKLIDEGKKRDLQFVLDVSSKSLELYEDCCVEGLTVGALRDVALACGDDVVELDDCGGNDDNNDDGLKADDSIMGGNATPKKDVNGQSNQNDNEDGGSSSTPATAAESTPSPQKRRGEDEGNNNIAMSSSTTTPASLMRKNIRSRRKKRPSGKSHHDTPNTKERTKENTSDTINSDGKPRADFHIQNNNDDELNMQDDDDNEKWSFLSSAQNQAAAESNSVDNGDEEERQQPQSPIRTRGMQQSLEFTAEEEEEDGNGVEMMQEDSESVEKELAVSKNEVENCDDEEEKDSENDTADYDDEVQEAAESVDKELAVSSRNVLENRDEEKVDDEINDENDSLVQTATLSFDHPNDTSNEEETRNNNGTEEALYVNEMPPPLEDSDDESKFSQGESDLIDEVKLSSRKRSERREVVRIMFTGVTPTRRHMQMIETIGAEIVESIEKAHTVTHVIVTDGRAKLRRTPKLMICICKTSNILSTEWLEQSANEQKVLDAAPFLWVNDKEAESKYNFSMKDTVQNGVLARKHRGGVFGGYYFYICSGIAGNRAPSLKEFKLIIEAAGGHLLNSLAPSEILDPLKTVILTSDPPTPSQLKERGVKNIAKCGGKLETTSWLFHSIITQTNSIYEDDDTVASVSTPGSRVSHVEVASPLPKKPQGAPIPSSDGCNHITTRDNCLSNNQAMSLMETLESSGDEAFILVHRLWQNHFNEGVKSSKTPRKASSKPTRRLRGRTHSLSPLVGATAASTNEKNGSAPKKESILHENPYITWEAIVLFTLRIRARKLEAYKSLVSDNSVPAGSHFSSPIAIQAKGKALSLLVSSDGVEIFGTLQDVFSLHQNRSSGMIPEPVVSSFALMAIEAVSAMHACGVVHNNIGMDSFLVAKRVEKNAQQDEWFLQMIGFGDKSIVLTCHEHDCKQTHYEHDYNCLANIIHQLLTGGIGITFTMKNRDGSVEFASKQFISGNLFLRGALSWCALMDALLGIGDVRRSNTSDQLRLAYPVNLLQLANEDDAPNRRLYQFGWSSRMLQELLSTQNDGLFTFLEVLCTLNSRFVLPNVNLESFACSPSPDNQTFEFATQLRIAKESESRHREFAQKEAKLEANALALEERESHHRGRAAQLKVDLQNNDRLHKSISKREREVQMREDQMAENMSQEEERLNRMKQAILLKEQRLEERIRQLEESKQRPREHREEQAVSKHSNARSPHNSSSLKRKNESLHQTPPPMHSNFQSLENDNSEMLSSQSKRRRSRINSNLEQLTPPQFKSDTNGMTNSNEEYPRQELNNSELYAEMKQQPHHESSQESRFSQESSSQKRKRGNRGKSPLALQLDSLQSLPKSPKKQPKKVFIAFEE